MAVTERGPLPREGLGQVRVGPEDADPVAGKNGMVPPRADLDRRRRWHHGDGYQVAVDRAEGARPGHHGLGHREVFAPQIQVEMTPAQAGLDQRRRGQRGHVERGARRDQPTDRGSDRGVGHLQDDADVGVQIADDQGRLQVAQVAVLDRDHGSCPVQAGVDQNLRQPGHLLDVGHAPPFEDRQQAVIGVVVDDHHGDIRAAQHLDDPQAQRVQPTDDHVTREISVSGGRRSHLPRLVDQMLIFGVDLMNTTGRPPPARCGGA